MVFVRTVLTVTAYACSRLSYQFSSSLYGYQAAIVSSAMMNLIVLLRAATDSYCEKSTQASTCTFNAIVAPFQVPDRHRTSPDCRERRPCATVSA